MALLKIELLNSNKIINDNAIVLNVKSSKGVNGKLSFYCRYYLLLSLFYFHFLLLLEASRKLALK
jgi:hypothetical protein